MKKFTLLMVLAVLSAFSLSASELVVDFSKSTYGISTSNMMEGTFEVGDDFTMRIRDGKLRVGSDGGIVRAKVSKGTELVFDAPANTTITGLTAVVVNGNFTQITDKVNISANGVTSSNTDTWEGSSSSVSLIINASGTTMIEKITITYNGGGSGEVTTPGAITFNPESGSTVATGSAVTFTSAGATSLSYTINDGAATEVSGATGTVTFDAAGTYVLAVTATNSAGTTQGTATYTVTLPAPGAIVFDPVGGIIPAGEYVSISSSGATSLAYSINNGSVTTLDGKNSAFVEMPSDPGTYVLAVTATNNGGTTTGSATYTIQGEAVSSDYKLVTNANQLIAGMQVVIGDPNNDPQTLLGAPVMSTATNLPAQTATITDGVVTNLGDGLVLTLVAGENGGWYLQDAEYNEYICSTQQNRLQLKGDNKTEFTIEIGEDGQAKIYYLYHDVKTYIGHTLASGNSQYITYYENQMTAALSHYWPCIYAKGLGDEPVIPVVPAPGDVTFNPAAGEVEANTVVTIASEGATSITYTYNGATETVNGASAQVTITANGTVEVTAKNEGGETKGSAAYTIKQTEEPVTPPTPDNAIYSGLVSTSDKCDWTMPSNNIIIWYDNGDGHCLSGYGYAADDYGYAFTTDYIALPDNTSEEDVIITATFEQWAENLQGVFDQGCRFVVRAEEDDAWTEFIPTEAAARANEFTTAKVSLTDFAGKKVLVGMKYVCTPESYLEWQIRNLVITASHVAGIENVAADAANAPAVYYNLQGTRVNAENLTPGIYVRVQGSTSTKVLVK